MNGYEGWYIDDVTVRASVESQYHKVELDNGETFDDIDFGNLALEAEPDLTIIEDEGTASFAQDKDKTYWIINNETDDEFQLHHKNGTTYNDESNPHWDGAAAEVGDSGYRFLLDGDKGRKGQAFVWDTDENGKIVGNSGWISDETSLHDLEKEFNHDLNDDGVIPASNNLEDEIAAIDTNMISLATANLF